MRQTSNQQKQPLNNLGRCGGPRPQQNSQVRSNNIATNLNNQVRPISLQPRIVIANNNDNAIVNMQRFPALQNQRQNNNVQPPPQVSPMIRQAPQRPPPNIRAVRPQLFQHHFLQNQNPITQKDFANAFSSVQNLINAYDEVDRSTLEDLTRQGSATLARNLFQYISNRQYDRFSVLMGTFEQAIVDYWNQRKLKETQGIKNQRKNQECKCDDVNCACVYEGYGLENPYQFIAKVCEDAYLQPFSCGICAFRLKRDLVHEDVRFVNRLIETGFLNSINDRTSFPLEYIFMLKSDQHFIQVIEFMIQSGFYIMKEYNKEAPSLFIQFFSQENINLKRMIFILKQVKQEIPFQMRDQILKSLSDNQAIDQNLKLELLENLGLKLYINKSKCFLYTVYRLNKIRVI
eukprot:403357493